MKQPSAFSCFIFWVLIFDKRSLLNFKVSIGALWQDIWPDKLWTWNGSPVTNPLTDMGGVDWQLCTGKHDRFLCCDHLHVIHELISNFKAIYCPTTVVQFLSEFHCQGSNLKTETHTHTHPSVFYFNFGKSGNGIIKINQF